MVPEKKLKVFLTIIEYLTLWIVGGFAYYGIEILWRGHSHVSMFIVGGICLIVIGLINEIFDWDLAFWKQVVIGDIVVLIIEFIAGCILNLWLGLGVWDYSNSFCNILGQVCLPYALLWIPVVAIAILLDDFLRWVLFGEDKPHYKLK